MSKPSRCTVFLFIAHYFASCLAQTPQNITIDDNNPAIIYTGNWNTSDPSNLDYGGSHKLTDDNVSNAKFQFTGVAVYFMSPLWPYAVFTQLQLDDQPPVILNLQDSNPNDSSVNGQETVQSAPVWGSGALQNISHTLTVSRSPNPNQQYAIVDAIIYTVLDAAPSSGSVTTTPSSSSTPSPPNSSSNGSSSNDVLPVALGTVLGALGLFAVLAALWLWRRGKKRPKSEAWTIAGAADESTSPPSGSSSSKQPPTQSMYNAQSYQPYAASPIPSSPWSGSSPPSAVPMLASSNHTPQMDQIQQPSQEFNPWSGFSPMQQQQHPQGNYPHYQQEMAFNPSPFYAPTTLSTITEMSTPGTLNSNRVPLGASPASYPSADLSYYTPPQAGDGPRLSHASDLPLGAMVYQHQQPYVGSSNGQLRSPPQSSASGTNGTPPGKLSKNSMVAVNRDDDEPEGSKPPAYSA